MKYKIALCDDEIEHIQILKLYLLEYFEGRKYSVEMDLFSSGIDLLDSFNQKKHYDAVFLDVEMGEDHGVDIAKLIRGISQDIFIFFVTSYPEFAVDGFAVRAFDYIVKPIQPNRLNKSLDEFCGKLREMNEKLTCKKLMIVKGKSSFEIPMNDILYFQKRGNKVIVICKDQQYEYYSSLNELKLCLDGNHFVQCHQGFIVNIDWITINSNYKIHLKTGIQIPVSRKYAKDMREAVKIKNESENVL